MSGMYDVVMGDHGQLIVPAELRRDRGWDVGARLFLLETDHGVVMTLDQLEAFVRSDLGGLDLVTELLDERHWAVAET